MRIHLSNVDFSSNTGPNVFGTRLSRQLLTMGHEIVPYYSVHDIFLAFIEAVTPSHSDAKKVLRLDGIWFLRNEFFVKNSGIRNCYYSFEHVIFQSEFDKNMAEHHFGERKDSSVINNGMCLDKIYVHGFVKDPNNLKFVCASEWRSKKRLKENIELFQIIRKQLIGDGRDAELWVLGKGADQWINGMKKQDLVNVKLIGNINHARQPNGDRAYLSYFSMADYMIHLAWLDHCPNVVVEALSQGCPVICTDSGGTHEIVKSNGIVIKETKEYNYELIDYDKPYDLDLSGFKLPDKAPVVDSQHLDIELVTKKYLEVFKK